MSVWASTFKGDDLPTVVSGLGRCGSSMMMQMLIAGGLETTGAACSPLYEDIRTLTFKNPDTANYDWLKNLDQSHVLKILDPGKYKPPKWFKCKVIWMERDPNEQAKSMAKYLGLSRPGVVVKTLGQTKKQIQAKERKSMKAMFQYEMFRVGFENTLATPFDVARAVKSFLRLPLNPIKMASVVLERDPECLDGFYETNKAFRQRRLR